MTFDFDKVINRNKTGSIKWAKYEGKDILPMWVADMDFEAPPAVIKALKKILKHGVFGYSAPGKRLENILVQRMKRHYDWEIERDWIVWLPGLVSGINALCRAFAGAGDEIMTTLPVYPPFLSAPLNHGQTCVKIPMKDVGNRFSLDFDAIRNAITSRTRIFILCSPYNPCGTIFSQRELSELASICLQNNILLVSDEIHADFILDEHERHMPTSLCTPNISNNVVTLMAPSKTFNIPGLSCSFAVISDENIRHRFKQSNRGILPDINVMGLAATEAAFEYGDDWLKELLIYLRKNSAYVYQRINSMKGLTMYPVASTYLAWIDARGLGMDNPFHFFESHGVGLSDGRDFGAQGFVRLNFGCPMALLEKGLDRMENAIYRLGNHMQQ